MTTHESPNEKKAKLLLADDEQIIRGRLQQLGEKLGFDVYAAADGLEAWEIFNREHPDLVVLDIYMPRMNGLQVLHNIKEQDSDCPVILITGFLQYEQLIQKDRVKPDGFIIKPFHLDKIANLMLQLVETRVAAEAASA
jgi:YesN/AraC family two-component response regulator